MSDGSVPEIFRGQTQKLNIGQWVVEDRVAEEKYFNY